MIGITKRKQTLIEDTKEEMRKKISFTKAINRIELCEKELMGSCNEITSAKVSALNAVINSNWKKIDKFLPNAAITKEESGSVQVIVNRERVAIHKGDERLTFEHESPDIEINR